LIIRLSPRKTAVNKSCNEKITTLAGVLRISLRSVKGASPAAARNFVYWGHLPSPQTPLDAHFYKQIKRTNQQHKPFLSIYKNRAMFLTA
jgi:hypothetical protein